MRENRSAHPPVFMAPPPLSTSVSSMSSHTTPAFPPPLPRDAVPPPPPPTIHAPKLIPSLLSINIEPPPNMPISGPIIEASPPIRQPERPAPPPPAVTSTATTSWAKNGPSQDTHIGKDPKKAGWPGGIVPFSKDSGTASPAPTSILDSTSTTPAATSAPRSGPVRANPYVYVAKKSEAAATPNTEGSEMAKAANSGEEKPMEESLVEKGGASNGKAVLVEGGTSEFFCPVSLGMALLRTRSKQGSIADYVKKIDA